MKRAKQKRTFLPSDFTPSTYSNHSRQLCDIKPLLPTLVAGTNVERYDGWEWEGGYIFGAFCTESDGVPVCRLWDKDGMRLLWPCDRVRVK